ncbi:hypothetical protein FQN57_001654 [Myotisia sp. PD_48]|nr:hypothetical protein FQN57_001654 [Myotisia sp. PD_48]
MARKEEIPPISPNLRSFGMTTQFRGSVSSIGLVKPDSAFFTQGIETEVECGVLSFIANNPMHSGWGKWKNKTERNMSPRQRIASLSEDCFVESIRSFGFKLLSEKQQKRWDFSSTPDIRFLSPTFICGHLCVWLEYKSYFGSEAKRSNEMEQLERYATEIGPGAVVYRLGIQEGYWPNIDGVVAFREKDVLDYLGEHHS